MEFTLTEFVLSTLLSAFGLVGVFTLISRVSRRGVEKHAVRNRIICRLCLHPFEDKSFQSTPECPQCHALNERKGDGWTGGRAF